MGGVAIIVLKTNPSNNLKTWKEIKVRVFGKTLGEFVTGRRRSAHFNGRSESNS